MLANGTEKGANRSFDLFNFLLDYNKSLRKLHLVQFLGQVQSMMSTNDPEITSLLCFERGIWISR